MELFFDLLAQHLTKDRDGTSILKEYEHKFRRLLQERHLMARNRDLASYVKLSAGKGPK